MFVKTQKTHFQPPWRLPSSDLEPKMYKRFLCLMRSLSDWSKEKEEEPCIISFLDTIDRRYPCSGSFFGCDYHHTQNLTLPIFPVTLCQMLQAQSYTYDSAETRSSLRGMRGQFAQFLEKNDRYSASTLYRAYYTPSLFAVPSYAIHIVL